MNLFLSSKVVTSTPFKIFNSLSWIAIPVIFLQLKSFKVKYLSKNSLPYLITISPRSGSYLSEVLSSDASITSVPYKLSYKLIHLALAAFKA